MQKKIYLPGLNGIRAIAAMSVIISHIGLGLEYYKMHNLNFQSFSTHAVTMFFALSGFLITFLLLKEKDAIGTIKIKNFYLRRIVRIWPLYYFYLFIIIVALKFKLDYNILYYLFMVPNYPYAIRDALGATMTVAFLAHYWSVGVEEQFYLFWPWIIKYSQNILKSLIAVAFGYFILKVFLTISNVNETILLLLHYTRFGCLALGGIFAYLFYSENKIIIWFKRPVIEIISWALLTIIFTDIFTLPKIIDHEIFSLLTLIIIINQVSNPKKIISLENKIFDYLGKISYGLYIYNPLVIFLVSLVVKNYLTSNKILNLAVIYFITTLTIIIISHLSYFYFENQFLKLKNKFAVIKSRSSAS